MHDFFQLCRCITHIVYVGEVFYLQERAIYPSVFLHDRICLIQLLLTRKHHRHLNGLIINNIKINSFEDMTKTPTHPLTPFLQEQK